MQQMRLDPVHWSLAFCLTTAAALAQTPYRAPRLPNGKPNLNGIWQAMNTANWDLQEHAARPGLVFALGAAGAEPGGPGVVEGGEIPYLPAAKEKKKENFEQSPVARSGNPLLSAGRAARDVHAVSVSDLPERQGHLLRLRI